LRGTVAESGGGRATLALADGQTVTGDAPPLPPGSGATLSLRPEAVRLLRAGAGTSGSRLSGTVAEIIYLGNAVRIGSTVGREVVWADLRDDEAEGIEVGTAVTLSWAPAAATIWAGSGT
jgi:hypothetical protein